MAEEPGKNRVQTEDRGGFLPNFCSIRNTFMVVVTAELLAMVLTLSADVSPQGLPQELGLRSLYVQWIALASAGLLCALRPWLRRLKNVQAGLVGWLLVQGVTLLVGEIAYRLMDQAGHGEDMLGDHRLFLLRSLGVSAIVAALGLRYIQVQYLWRRQMVAESQARWQALQSRIRPHFLFNSMNTIASLTRIRPEIAEQAVQDLADLFRASLSRADRLSTLGDELELARGYLRIEGQRLGDRLRVEWDLEDLPEEAVMPPLMLQPLLENAVYHGIEPSPGGGAILITGRYRRRKVNLSIRNTQPPAGGGGHSKGNRMALDNIRQRLDGAFEGEARLTMSEVEGDYQVRLVFPHPWKP
ncbi:MAG TPA: sensor histidine kinase [Sedimenticola sp.]|nr:sensor histidine kinase [Sedimenticola sp.]